jgi:hypothetical protein
VPQTAAHYALLVLHSRSGKAYASAAARYSDGWAFSKVTRRWLKAEKQQARVAVASMSRENEALKQCIADAAVVRAAEHAELLQRMAAMTEQVLVVH